MSGVHGVYQPKADVMGNESVPIQLAQCRFPGLAIYNAKISNSTRKLLWFGIAKRLIAV